MVEGEDRMFTDTRNSALYAHKFHTLWWNDVEDPEKWGFASKDTAIASAHI